MGIYYPLLEVLNTLGDRLVRNGPAFFTRTPVYCMVANGYKSITFCYDWKELKSPKAFQ